MYRPALILCLALLLSCAPDDGGRLPRSAGMPDSPEGRDRPATRTDEGDWAEDTAARLANVDEKFNDLLEVWIDETDSQPYGAKFRDLELLGLKKQKLMRRLVKFPRLSKDVLPMLPKRLRLEAHRNIKAGRDLYRLTQPIKGKVRMKTSKPKGPTRLLGYYDEAERRFDVPWTILASINLIESKMGRLNGPSSAGALGPMQFMPATWDAYGRGSPFNTHNAIMAAARYLAANGAPQRMRNALWNYNHSDLYVNAVLAYHRHMKTYPKSYYGYYFWQVFVRTAGGDKQLTGPGSNYRY
jgi:hypothetical protein